MEAAWLPGAAWLELPLPALWARASEVARRVALGMVHAAYSKQEPGWGWSSPVLEHARASRAYHILARTRRITANIPETCIERRVVLDNVGDVITTASRSSFCNIS